MNNQAQMNAFLNSPIGRRMMAIATKEQEAYTKKLNEMKGNVADLKEMYRHLVHGSDQNAQNLVMLDGHPVIVETDGASRVKTIKDLTPEVFAGLDLTSKQALKQAMPVLYGRLEANDMPQVSKSDRYYQLKETSAGQRIELFRELAEHHDVNDRDAYKNYSSPEQRSKGITKKAEELQAMFSADNIRAMNGEIMSLENQIKRSEETEEIAPYVDILATEGVEAE
ncbi:hypothetical protein CN513_14200 [Bacillus cereus]|uniref:hypothetical protein n=1 Tax=Bacillus cereus TaxID=1396 RepID=UPI000BF5A8EF|nr:hypothetical protein [Bacillus cereus]PET17562.1 hypothetical protein CN513_14200 [Bacillus cereus]PEV54077.1 hypothetical protein CN422_29470 [Bacillus cereus]PFQ53002.1 hypothetical protein COK24_17595 [Bacillus cereus]